MWFALSEYVLPVLKWTCQCWRCGLVFFVSFFKSDFFYSKTPPEAPIILATQDGTGCQGGGREGEGG